MLSSPETERCNLARHRINTASSAVYCKRTLPGGSRRQTSFPVQTFIATELFAFEKIDNFCYSHHLILFLFTILTFGPVRSKLVAVKPSTPCRVPILLLLLRSAV